MKKQILIVVGVILLVGGSVGVWASGRNKTATDSNANDLPLNTSSPGGNDSSNTQSSTTVEISGFAFAPETLRVKKGTTVTWTNKDSSAHTVTATDGKNGPHSTNLDAGKSYRFTFNETGTFKYKCVLHPDMSGSVVVE